MVWVLSAELTRIVVASEKSDALFTVKVAFGLLVEAVIVGTSISPTSKMCV